MKKIKLNLYNLYIALTKDYWVIKLGEIKSDQIN